MSIQKINRKSKPFLVRGKNADGKPVSATFATRSEAEEFEKSLKSEKRMPAELQLNALDRADLARIKALCEQKNRTLHEALKVLEAAFKNGNKPIAPAAAITRFLDALEARNARPATYNQYKWHLAKFADWLNLCGIDNLQNVTPALAQEFINSVKSKDHARRALRPFFNFLKVENLLSENPFLAVKIPALLDDQKPIPFMSVEATRENLRALRPEFKPLYALMTFAGIRPEELISKSKKDNVKIDDIDFKNQRITIRPSVAKCRKMRIISGVKNLWPWLEPIKNWGAICPREIKFLNWNKGGLTKNVYEQWQAAKRRLPHKIPHDALRHSFATYAYYALGVERAIEILGHDYNVYIKHYKGLAPEADCKAYFEIYPD